MKYSIGETVKIKATGEKVKILCPVEDGSYEVDRGISRGVWSFEEYELKPYRASRLSGKIRDVKGRFCSPLKGPTVENPLSHAQSVKKAFGGAHGGGKTVISHAQSVNEEPVEKKICSICWLDKEECKGHDYLNYQESVVESRLAELEKNTEANHNNRISALEEHNVEMIDKRMTFESRLAELEKRMAVENIKHIDLKWCTTTYETYISIQTKLNEVIDRLNAMGRK